MKEKQTLLSLAELGANLRNVRDTNRELLSIEDLELLDDCIYTIESNKNAEMSQALVLRIIMQAIKFFADNPFDF